MKRCIGSMTLSARRKDHLFVFLSGHRVWLALPSRCLHVRAQYSHGRNQPPGAAFNSILLHNWGIILWNTVRRAWTVLLHDTYQSSRNP